MNLLRCHVLGFGKLNDCSFSFARGLNLVFAPNEGGKSTLQRFLIALLYGQLRPDLRTQRRLEPWVEDFKPWRGTEYGGALWCSLQNGRELEVRRAFGKDEARIEIRTATGEEVTLTYEQQRNGEVLFARSHLGLPKDVFESIAVIRENRVAELNSRDTLRDRIANLAQSGDEEQSVPQSLGLLEAALEAIGSERAPTKPYKQTLDLIEALRAERKDLDARRLEFEGWLGGRNRLSGEVQKLERQLQVARSALMTARWREAAEQVRTLEELEIELGNLRAEIKSSDGRPDFPAHELDTLNHLIGAKENIDKRSADSAREVEAAATRLQTDEANRAALAPYAVLMESVETEKITEWFVKYMGTAFHRDEALRSLNLTREEILALEDRLAALGPALSDPSVDWERCAREASEKERISSEQILIVAQRLTDVKELVARFQRRTAKWRGFAAAGLLLALAALAGWRFLGSDRLPALPTFAAAAAFAAAAIVAFASSVRSRAAARPMEQQVTTLETERSRWRDESVKASREIREAMDSSGFKLVEEFLDAAREAAQWRQRLQMLRGRMKDLEKQHEKVTSESAEFYARLQETLARVGLQCSPGTVKSKVDIVRANLRRFREMDESYRGSLRQVEDLRLKAKDIAGEADQNAARIQAILAAGGVDAPEAFRDACRKRLRLLELLEKEALRQREFQRLCGKLTLEEWRDQLRELGHWKERARELAAASAAPAEDNGSPAAEMPLLPYQPSVSDAEEEERRFIALIATTREEHARLAERVSQAFLSFRSASEIDEDFAQAERTFEGLSLNREALEAGLDTLRALAREQQEVLAPQLNDAVGQRFLQLCRGRYQEVKIDPDFQVWVRETVNGDLRPAEALSRGTQDQLYFALRFGILELLADSEESCPALFDEPFAAYDQSRLEEAFRILQAEALRRQLLVFTCREDLRDLGLTYGAHLIQLTIDD
jgi:hypothetical protein